MLTHTLGFPRMGLKRELKRALEGYWKGRIAREDLLQTARELRERHWRLQADEGVDLVPVGDASLYDHVLDTTAMLGAVPPRYGWSGGMVDLDTLFAMARGRSGAAGQIAMEMTKWFDTNYHYIVPEFHRSQTFELSSVKLLDELIEARDAGINAKPVLLGPMSYIHLGKSVDAGFDRWDHLDAIVDVYQQLLVRLGGRCEWVQIDEPILVLALPRDVRKRFAHVYERLRKATGQTRMLLATYFGRLGDNVETVLDLPVDAVHLDLVRAPEQAQAVLPRLPQRMRASLGVVDGRNVWRVEMDAAVPLVRRAVDTLGPHRVMVAPSCSLLHVPIDLQDEANLDAEVRGWMAFARQKCRELRGIADEVAGEGDAAGLEENRAAWRARRASAHTTDAAVRRRAAGVTDLMRCRLSPFQTRKALQQEHLRLPSLPTTTIGSFPQTPAIRAARAEHRKGRMGDEAYAEAMRDEIRHVVRAQEEIGLDVLVHGEPERNDMVEYFGQQLAGYCFTDNGWVQSYGSRCVKPPIIFGDVHRPRAMTVEWSTFAQSLTGRPMKGMLTGPVTILQWSFVRDDQPRSETCRQIALAIRDEVTDLEQAGLKVIQIDEPALREGLPLRREDWDEYLHWAVDAFRLATSGVADTTQIHTHMCYAEFNDIVEWIARMDADVISIEASRSRMELLKAFREYRYPNDVGPGVWDIHSPRVPTGEEMLELIRLAADVVPVGQLWVNPDCGLKTRDWPETSESLRNMVAAAKIARGQLVAPARH